MVSSLLDEGAGDLDAKAFHQRLEDNAIELRFSATPRLFLRARCALLKERQDESFELLRLALNAAALRRRRRSSACASRSWPALRRETTDPGSDRQPHLVAHRLPGPSLRPAEQRHARRRSRPSPPTICGPMRARCCRRDTPEGRRRRRHRRRRRSASCSTACSARCRPTARCAAVPDAPVRDGRPPHRGRAQRAAGGGAHRRRRHRAQGPGLHRRPISSTTSSAAARSRRGSIDEVREKRGLAYGVYSYLLTLRPRRAVHGRDRRPGRPAPARRWS